MGRPPWGRGWPTPTAAVLVPASLIARLLHGGATTFVLAAAAVVPLAALLGRATEQLASQAGARVGGLLNATFGNAAELIIGLALVARGEVAVVTASITGSIIGNLLLVLGAAFLAGGLRHRELTFSVQSASTHVVSMTLAVAGVLLPSIYARSQGSTGHRIEVVSVGVAIVLVGLYIVSLVYSIATDSEPFGATPEGAGESTWSRRAAVLTIAAVSVLIAAESDLLAGAVGGAVSSFGVSRAWLGLIIVPIVGNASEHATAVMVARRAHGDLALNIAAGSSAQIALVVTPLLVFAGLVAGHHLTLVFSPFEIGALAVSVAVVGLISLDGKANWLEGAQLLGLYAIVAMAGFYVGRS